MAIRQYYWCFLLHLYYILDYIYFHQKRHPQQMGVDEIRADLPPLAVHKNIAVSTQNIDLSALLFLVLKLDLPNVDHIERAKRPKRLQKQN